MNLRRPLVALFLIFSLYGCSSGSIDENNPTALLEDAEQDISSDHYQIAIEKLKKIKNKFPYAKESAIAHLRIADVYFLQELFPEAAAVYESFSELHPNHTKTPYAMYRVAKSYYSDIPSTVARDLSTAKLALKAYQGFLGRFSQDEHTKDAQKDLESIRGLLSEKELYIADFYFIRDFYDSAKPRYEKILNLYPDTASAVAAREKLAEIEKIKQKKRGDSHGSGDATNKDIDSD